MLRGPASATLGVSVEKRLEVDRARRRLRARVPRRRTTRPRPARVAPWEVTRVQPNGLTFFATGAGRTRRPICRRASIDGVTWVHHDAAVIAGHQKLFADAAEGWVAHVDDDALFVKTFDARAARVAHAPGEAQVEIYASSLHRYVEVEQQGACETLPPGGALAWRVEWRVRRLPAERRARDRQRGARAPRARRRRRAA